MLELFKNTRNNYSPCNPTHLHNVLKGKNDRFSKLLNGKMQDAHEFFALIAEQMEIEKHSLKWFERFFVSDIQTCIRCSVCENDCESSGLLGDLTIDVKHESIQTALDTYFSWEAVDSYDCTTCKKKVAAKKRHLFLSFPKCLCITLKRFSMDRKKINQKIEIDLNLSVAGYSDGNAVSKKQVQYKLVSLVNHVGRTSISGHYTTTVCSPNEVFYEFDDRNVRRCNGNAIKQGDAYILFYERIEVIAMMNCKRGHVYKQCTFHIF